MDRQKVQGIDELLAELPLPLLGLAGLEQALQRRGHRPRSGQELVHEQPRLNVSVAGLLAVTLEQAHLFLLGQSQAQNGLGQIVDGVEGVQLVLVQAVMLVVCLEQAGWPVNPLGGLHLPIDQRGQRAGLLRQPSAQARPHQARRQEPAIGPARYLLQQAHAIVMTVQSQARQRILLQSQPARSSGNIGGDRRDPFVPRCGSAGGLRQPSRVQDAVAQSQQRRDQATEALTRQEGVVAQPAPADALGQHPARFRLPDRRKGIQTPRVTLVEGPLDREQTLPADQAVSFRHGQLAGQGVFGRERNSKAHDRSSLAGRARS